MNAIFEGKITIDLILAWARSYFSSYFFYFWIFTYSWFTLSEVIMIN
jgi:hypothetical protein